MALPHPNRICFVCFVAELELKFIAKKDALLLASSTLFCNRENMRQCGPGAIHVAGFA